MIKWLIVLMSFCVLLSCKGDKATTVEPSAEELGLSNELPEDFLTFYMKFHSDSIFQVEHIVFPLKMKADSTSYLKADWVMHQPFDDNKGEFSQSFINMNGLIIERISSSNQIFRMERRFVKSGTSYELIYYHIQNAFRNSTEWEEESAS